MWSDSSRRLALLSLRLTLGVMIARIKCWSAKVRIYWPYASLVHNGSVLLQTVYPLSGAASLNSAKDVDTI